MIQQPITETNWDRIIIGAGVAGLWHARHAIKRGEQTLVLEKRFVGAGGSGGFLGALMPHMPDSWNDKKQFQYEGLSSIGAAIDDLESDTGLTCGFRRCGRVMPLQGEAIAVHAQQRIEGSRRNWADRYSMDVHASPIEAGLPNGWIDPGLAPFGIVRDTLSARVNPRKYLEALKSFVSLNGVLVEGVGIQEIRPDEYSVTLGTGEILKADMIVVASGWEAYPLLQPYMGAINDELPIGRGVKGQAVLVDFEHADDLPIVYHDGVYVVPHAENRVAIGSTSINDWQSAPNPKPDFFDPQDMIFFQKAMDLVPALRDVQIVDRWAGVRPRNTLKGRGTSPWFGPVTGHDNLIALIGGFKITLGIAHLEVNYT